MYKNFRDQPMNETSWSFIMQQAMKIKDFSSFFYVYFSNKLTETLGFEPTESYNVLDFEYFKSNGI